MLTTLIAIVTSHPLATRYSSSRMIIGNYSKISQCRLRARKKKIKTKTERREKMKYKFVLQYRYRNLSRSRNKMMIMKIMKQLLMKRKTKSR